MCLVVDCGCLLLRVLFAVGCLFIYCVCVRFAMFIVWFSVDDKLIILIWGVGVVLL